MDNRLFDTRGYNTDTNNSVEIAPMFDRRKALITAAEIIEEWEEKYTADTWFVPDASLDVLTEILEKHLERVFKRGYMSAINPESLDNQKSE